MTHTLMNQKRIHACERIETLDGEPIVGQRCKLRLWNGDQYTDIHTSAVTNWWCGYPYWDPEVMKSKFDSANDPDSLHDSVTYRAAEPKLMATYEANKDRVAALAAELLPNLDLAGQWSIDIMQDGEDLWLIDMALAENSAFYRETVPATLMRPSEEQWMPELPANEE